MSESGFPIESTIAESAARAPVEVARDRRPRYWLHGLLFVLTCFTTLVMGARMQYNFAHNLPALSFSDESLSYFPVEWTFSHPKWLLAGWPFAVAVMLFFLAHEMGHYLYCRYYGIYATLPFFIPMPTPIGTMGAVIAIRSPIRSRTALFDIGIAGPIAGFVVALSLLVISLGWAKPMAGHAGIAEYELGYPLIFQLVHRWLAMLHPASAMAALPLERALLHPVTIAAWVGMLATALNLLPGGQLDGGHIVYSISPQAHRLVSRLTILILLVLAYYLWTGWIVWAILLHLSSFRHPQVAELPRVSGMRAWLAGFALLMLVCTLTWAPSGHHALPETMRDLSQALRDLWQSVGEWLRHWRGR